jgi:hypothetical protein
MADFAIFLFQIIAALVDGMRSRWRYVAAFLLSDLLLVLMIFVDGIYSTTFHEHVEHIIGLFTTMSGALLLWGVGVAGMIGVRVLIALKI